jgi:hypothetical protein
VIGRPKRPTEEQLRRILGDDATSRSIGDGDERAEMQRLLAELHDLGLRADDGRLSRVTDLAGLRALHAKVVADAASGKLSGQVRYCAVCQKTKNTQQFVRRKFADWCLGCEKDPTTASARDLRAADLGRVEREALSDARPEAFIKRNRARLPQHTAADERLRAAAIRAVNQFFNLLPQLRHLKRMQGGYPGRSVLGVPRSGNVSDPTGRDAVHGVDDPAVEAATVIPQMDNALAKVVGIFRRAVHLVPDQPEATPRAENCIGCGKPIDHKGKCWQAAYRRRSPG